MEELVKSDYNALTIGKIVARDYRKAMVFKSFGLDFCCGGNIKLETAAAENNLNLNEVIEALEKVDDSTTDITSDFNSWPLPQLIDHIVDKHHNYVESTITQLMPLVEKVTMVHGDWRPELKEVKELFIALSQELTAHMKKEELILFPAIKKLVAGYESEGSTCFGSVSNPINMMEHEHDIAGDLMKKINLLTDGYTLPKGACATYTVVYKVLNEFEEDLFRHIHLENNILFPKAIELEG